MLTVQSGILVLVAAYAALAHLLVGTHVVLGKLLLPEYDVETHSEDAYHQQQQGNEERSHKGLEYEFRTQRFVIVNLVDYVGEHLRHTHNPDLGIVRKFRMRNGVGDVNFFES